MSSTLSTTGREAAQPTTTTQGGAMSLKRREFLVGGALVVGGGLALPFGSSASTGTVSPLALANTPRPFTQPLVLSPTIRGRVMWGKLQDGTTEGRYRLFTIIEEQANANILPGLTTPVYGYSYVDDAGVKRAVRVPGPIIDVDRADTANGGLPVKVRVINRLPAQHPQWTHDFDTSTHLHGSASLPQYDGYADDVTEPQQYKDYWYPNFQSARTLWYHDHGVHHTGKNAYGGLAAQYHLHDRYEERDLPAGAYDVGLTLSDAMFHADGKLAWDENEHSGLWGDVILVNGVPWPVMQVKRRIYRFRLLNASIARSFRLHLSNNASFAVVGTDGGLMPNAVMVKEYKHAGAERYELLIDFSKYAVGTKIDLLNRSNINNRDYDHTNKVMRFQVVDGTFPTTRNTLTPRLPRHPIMDIPVSESKRTRVFELDHNDVTNIFQINHRTWEDVRDSKFTETLTGNITPQLGDVEIWEFQNRSGGWYHPLHIHLVDFRVLSRNGAAARPYEYGPKDVVYIGEDEVVRLLVQFKGQPDAAGWEPFRGGKYMVHCHNLPHEDSDMMQQFAVGAVPVDTDPNGMFSAAAKDLGDRPPTPNGKPSQVVGDDAYVPKVAGAPDPYGDGYWLSTEA